MTHAKDGRDSSGEEQTVVCRQRGFELFKDLRCEKGQVHGGFYGGSHLPCALVVAIVSVASTRSTSADA
jgi:hypothetical protein